MPTLKKIGKKQIRQLVSHADITYVSKSGEPVFYIEVKRHIPVKTDPLIDVEIALRKGERVGLFSSAYAKQPRA